MMTDDQWLVAHDSKGSSVRASIVMDESIKKAERRPLSGSNHHACFSLFTFHFSLFALHSSLVTRQMGVSVGVWESRLLRPSLMERVPPANHGD